MATQSSEDPLHTRPHPPYLLTPPLLHPLPHLLRHPPGPKPQILLAPLSGQLFFSRFLPNLRVSRVTVHDRTDEIALAEVVIVLETIRVRGTGGAARGEGVVGVGGVEITGEEGFESVAAGVVPVVLDG